MSSDVKRAVLTCGREVSYRHTVKAGLKNIYISVDADGVILVKAPAVPEKTILSVIEKKAEWIFRRMSVTRERLDAVRFEDGCPVPLFGVKYPLEIIRNPLAGLGRADVYLSGGCIKAEINPYLFKEEYFFKALETFRKRKAEDVITPMLEKRSSEMGLIYRKVSFRKTGSRWGSCSSLGRISINYELTKLPAECADYVCVHELAHLRHPNHSDRFWALVAEYVPDYKRIRQFMKSCVTG
ncbi:M48 family peptidase [Geovibrio thiophilus]|uniref:M48 family peptidase n=1 Tax=Geovibrio thiophilus TaxID=139438 RepID=A0A3R6AX71_9BACT|nr:SprT family zinc-dependent metalloprotease [Geovibrio thiophilus]QAR32521.1 M48 family peptidase [Geovibrio thiophilus]